MSRKEQLRQAAKTYYAKNRDKILAKKKADRKNNPDKMLNWRLKSRYGITLEEWNKLFERQAGCCAICERHTSMLDRKPDRLLRLVVDQDHTTGRVRGLLCHECNAALGLMSDDPDRLLRAAGFLINQQ